MEVNTQITPNHFLDGDSNNLLSAQIRMLQQCLDVYYEVCYLLVSFLSCVLFILIKVVLKETTETQTGGKFCIRTHRGRGRLLPFVFNEGTGLFDQRDFSS